MALSINVGNFRINIAEGGHPIWCEIYHEAGTRSTVIHGLNALQLRDLEYAVKSARREARNIARRMDKERIKDY